MTRKSTIEPQQYTPVGNGSDKDTPKSVLRKQIKKRGKFLKHFVAATVWVIKLLEWWG